MSTAKPCSAHTSTLVRSLRDLCGLTQGRFASKLEVSLVTINRWKNDRDKPLSLALRQIKALLVKMRHSPVGVTKTTADHLHKQYFFEEI